MVLQVNKAENKSYDQEYEKIVEGEHDFDEIDFGMIITREYRKLATSRYSSRNSAKRS